jgi:hypothetical protein
LLPWPPTIPHNILHTEDSVDALRQLFSNSWEFLRGDLVTLKTFSNVSRATAEELV